MESNTGRETLPKGVIIQMLSRIFCLATLSLAFLLQSACTGEISPELIWVPPDDIRLQWLNVAGWEQEGEAFRPARVPRDWRDRFPERTAQTAMAPAGVVLRIATDARKVALRINVDPPRPRPAGAPPRPPSVAATAFDVYRNNEFLLSASTSGEPGTQEITLYENPSNGSGEIAVLFPYGLSFVVQGVGFSSGAQFAPPNRPAQPRVLFYGDSITQGTGATHSRNTYVWVTCEELGCDPINLGFGGSAWGDQPVADYVTSRNDWNALVVAYGTNTYRRAHENPEQFAQTYNTFLTTIRAEHPDVPILCITPLWRIQDTTNEKNEGGYTHQQYRDAATRVVMSRQSSDANLHLLEGKELVPENLFTADQVHPNNEGAAQMAEAIANALRSLLGKVSQTQLQVGTAG